MSLPLSTRLGPYQIQASLGRGGMGEVYRALDTRLGREVAIKLLLDELSSDPDRLWRFEQEARAIAAINHPNLLQIYDTGRYEGVPYLVMELLEGHTLRTRMDGQRLAPSVAVALAVQIARGLSAAHGKGIVHRDLKPENIFLTRDEQVKILDFGLAKLAPQTLEDATTQSPGGPQPTRAGTVVGTVGYMSPEQVGGRGVDARSDLFSLGVVLWEMLCGTRPFHGATVVETMHAILKEEPRALPADVDLPPALVRLLQRCLSKDPLARFQSAQDLAFALEALDLHHSSRSLTLRIPSLGGLSRRWLQVTLAAGLLAVIGGACVWGMRQGASPVPTLVRLTYHRGLVSTARFTPDGQGFLIAKGPADRPPTLFMGRLDGLKALPLDVPEGYRLLSVSRAGELALLQPGLKEGYGMLCRAPMTGGAPRQVLEDVREADWSPDGKDLAVLRAGREGRLRVEYPIGTVLYEVPPFNVVECLRVSPSGKEVVLLEHLGLGTGSITLINRKGQRRVLADTKADTILWSPTGRELVYTRQYLDDRQEIRVISLRGRDRLLHAVQGRVKLWDMAPSGAILMSHNLRRVAMFLHREGEAEDQELSWLQSTAVADLSADGQTVLFAELLEGRGPGGVYMRRIHDREPVRIGDGDPLALSDDAKWAIAKILGHPSDLLLLPLGPGQPIRLNTRGVQADWALFAGPSQIVLGGNVAGGLEMRVHVLDLPTGVMRTLPTLIPKETFAAVSPDRRNVVVGPVEGDLLMIPLDGSAVRRIPGFGAASMLLQWTDQPHSVYTVDSLDRMPTTIRRFDLLTGRSTPFRVLHPRGGVDLQKLRFISITPDGKTLAYSCDLIMTSDLYLMEGWR